MSSRPATVAVTVIVPVYNQPAELAQCLAALEASAGPDSEIIVVDDGSTGDMVAADAPTSARVLRLADNAGPAAARNHGARHARGEILLFVDADVIVAPGAVQHVTRVLSGDPTSPRCSAPTTRARAAGAWSRSTETCSTTSCTRRATRRRRRSGRGAERCGARRSRRWAGFDAARFRRPSIEDIELGYRLARAGYRIRLDRDLQCTHLKRWRLPSISGPTSLAARCRGRG